MPANRANETPAAASKTASGQVYSSAEATSAGFAVPAAAQAATLSAPDEARCLNTLGRWLGVRDVAELSHESLDAAGVPGGQVDVAVLFGGSIPAGGEVFAKAMRAGVARAYVVVGGAGHTTQSLRDAARAAWPRISFAADASEAEIFAAYLSEYEGLEATYLETASTNCGNNITYLRSLLSEKGVPAQSYLLMQDATMMRRMAAVLEKEQPRAKILSYATYKVEVAPDADGTLAITNPPLGMWGIPRYRTLLMGEVPRLRDDENGYGPNGASYLAHVGVPTEVEAAYETLAAAYPEGTRVANKAYASANN